MRKLKEAPAPDAAPAFPATFGACADRLYEMREARYKLQKEVAAMQEKETALTNHVINTLPKTDGGAIGKKAKLALIIKEVPKVDDWDALYKFILKKKRFDLLQRRTNNTAVGEMWENGESVPGISSFTTVSLSVTKK